ncbi:nucleotide exchange factor GrpE [Candidatus Saccharibacteria bacterium]|nr:nucleotide exchange factor GrpE [Candidatus Saccharibacteria bacterium]MDQ5958867.1 molecular chaperone GrpE [Patescibacteria group bacterium]
MSDQEQPINTEENNVNKPIKQKKFKKNNNQKIIQELTDDIKRIQAEYINYKRRSEEEKQRAVALGKEQAVSVLLPIIDNLERAIVHQPKDIADHAWVKGVAGVEKQLNSQLQGIGLVKIGVVGDEFNPDLHNAVSMQEGDGDKEVITAVLQSGFMLDGKVVRHAMVQVGKK